MKLVYYTVPLTGDTMYIVHASFPLGMHGDVVNWCDGAIGANFLKSQDKFYFSTEQDALLFMLRWRDSANGKNDNN